MKSNALGILLGVLWGASCVSAQMSIDQASVSNAASYLPAGLPNFGIAQGSIFVVKGQNLGACGTAKADQFPLTGNLAGTEMKVTVGETTKDVLMLYVVGCIGNGSGSQLSGIIPSDTPTGDGQLTITYNGSSATAAIKIIRNAFGIFTLNQAGWGPAIVQNFNSEIDYRMNTRFESLKPGQAAILWGTGLGAHPDNSDAGPPAALDLRANYAIKVYLGGKEASLLFAGRSADSPGIDQVNFLVPEGVEGCEVPVAVVVNNVSSNFGTVAIARDAGICSDSVGFTSKDFSTAIDGGALKFGAVNLNRTTISTDLPGFSMPTLVSDSASAVFQRLEVKDLTATSGRTSSLPPGSCLVFAGAEGAVRSIDPVTPVGLDAGARVRMIGAQGFIDMAALSGFKGYYAVPGDTVPYLDPGAYTIATAGGADVGAFSASVTLPTLLPWTNQESISSIARSQGITVRWNAGAPDSLVIISGYSSDGNAKVDASFYCVERGSVGRFTVPSYVLSALPVTQVDNVNDLGAALMVGATGQYASFAASGLDKGVVNSTSLAGKIVTYQ